MPNQEPLALDNQLCFALYSTSLAMTQLYKPLLEPLGLTYPQYLIMLVLWEHDSIGLKDIGARLGQQSGSLTPVIKRLEQEGWISRVRDPMNERSLIIRLTPEGTALKTEAAAAVQCIVESCGMELNVLAELRDKLHQLRQKLQSKS